MILLFKLPSDYITILITSSLIQRIKDNQKRDYQNNKEKRKEYAKKRYANPEIKKRIRAKGDEYMKNYSHEKKLANTKRFRENLRKDPERYAAYKESAKKEQTERCRKKRENKDSFWYKRFKLRGAVYAAFRNHAKGHKVAVKKNSTTEDLLGCSFEDAVKHIESLFTEGMSWDNMGEWHIDHIRPCSSFKKNELHLMNHYTNLQPLWALDNIRKGNKI
jgi:hypothetical protein